MQISLKYLIFFSVIGFVYNDVNAQFIDFWKDIFGDSNVQDQLREINDGDSKVAEECVNCIVSQPEDDKCIFLVNFNEIIISENLKIDVCLKTNTLYINYRGIETGDDKFSNEVSIVRKIDPKCLLNKESISNGKAAYAIKEEAGVSVVKVWFPNNPEYEIGSDQENQDMTNFHGTFRSSVRQMVNGKGVEVTKQIINSPAGEVRTTGVKKLEGKNEEIVQNEGISIKSDIINHLNENLTHETKLELINDVKLKIYEKYGLSVIHHGQVDDEIKSIDNNNNMMNHIQHTVKEIDDEIKDSNTLDKEMSHADLKINNAMKEYESILLDDYNRIEKDQNLINNPAHRSNDDEILNDIENLKKDITINENLILSKQDEILDHEVTKIGVEDKIKMHETQLYEEVHQLLFNELKNNVKNILYMDISKDIESSKNGVPTYYYFTLNADQNIEFKDNILYIEVNNIIEDIIKDQKIQLDNEEAQLEQFHITENHNMQDLMSSLLGNFSPFNAQEERTNLYPLSEVDWN